MERGLFVNKLQLTIGVGRITSYLIYTCKMIRPLKNANPENALNDDCARGEIQAPVGLGIIFSKFDMRQKEI